MANELHKTSSSTQLEFIGYRKNESSNDRRDETEIDDDAHHYGVEVPRIRGGDPHRALQKKSCPNTLIDRKQNEKEG
jgi:hypothetical protein